MPSAMIAAISSALLIGILLSVLGSGGSILTVPILLYIIGMTPEMAIASSLAVVGMISVFSSVRYIRTQQVSWRFVLLFGLPGMFGTYSGAWLGTQIDSTIQLSVFVFLMLIAAIMMFRKSRGDNNVASPALEINSELNAGLTETESPNETIKTLFSLIQGFLVGVVTGVVGVGGGFLIVPALVLLAKLTIKTAIGTSLIIITANSAVGFFKYHLAYSEIGLTFDWPIIFILAGGGVLGSLLGGQISKRVPTDKLQQIFALFLVVMAIFIFIKSII